MFYLRSFFLSHLTSSVSTLWTTNVWNAKDWKITSLLEERSLKEKIRWEHTAVITRSQICLCVYLYTEMEADSTLVQDKSHSAWWEVGGRAAEWTKINMQMSIYTHYSCFTSHATHTLTYSSPSTAPVTFILSQCESKHKPFNLAQMQHSA